MEEKLARQRVKDQIEQDKIARRTKFGMTSPPEVSQQPEPILPATVQSLAVSQPPKDYSETRLQVSTNFEKGSEFVNYIYIYIYTYTHKTIKNMLK